MLKPVELLLFAIPFFFVTLVCYFLFKLPSLVVQVLKAIDKTFEPALDDSSSADVFPPPSASSSFSGENNSLSFFTRLPQLHG